jgi:superfamily II DNA or RNA helicase
MRPFVLDADGLKRNSTATTGETCVTGRIDEGSRPEELFAELFAQQFGPEKAQCLIPEYAFTDIEGQNRYIDYALKTGTINFAFEIDGLQWHHPATLSVMAYEDQLLRQNSLVHIDWHVLRWTDRQIALEPERVKDQLALFLEKAPRFLSFDDFLPRQSGTVIDLRNYQVDALTELQRLRATGNTIALLAHPTGSGKTTTAVLDAKRLGGRTLFIAHRDNLVRQARREFKKLWPERRCGLFLGNSKDYEAPIVSASIQALAQSITLFAPEAFAYVIVDEAHHASADTYRTVLSYFMPRFILGITATPERTDQKDILEVFRNYAHRLSLEEAIRTGHLAAIRCVRVETNINLSKVRFNSVNYLRRDLEGTIRIPSRDKLIVDTYLQNVPGRRAVVFAVNVDHGEVLAEQFRSAGVAARSVSGRVPVKERETILEQFRKGELLVLCACDVLNEGWDCPELEVLLMARPTLSKVLYLQQLGRGTRKAPGKEELIVFDFIDNALRYNVSQSLHRILLKKHYIPGALVEATTEAIQNEAEATARGEKPMQTLHVSLWTKGLKEIDIFNWQELSKDMLSVGELEVALAVGEGFIRRAIERGEIAPDHHFTIGDRTYHYFANERQEEIREMLGLPKVTDETIKSLFMKFVCKMDMASSYKPVFLRSYLSVCDETGCAQVADVAERFRAFYEKRKEQGLAVENPKMDMAAVTNLTLDEVKQILLRMPFEKFERRHYFRYARDLAYIEMKPSLWKQLTPEDIEALRYACEKGTEAYYARLAS